ncbi:MAG: transposase [Spirochaetaceae bacterium]|jgi:transposase|nr:transposase [Spirochaetaceae bacterium]
MKMIKGVKGGGNRTGVVEQMRNIYGLNYTGTAAESGAGKEKEDETGKETITCQRNKRKAGRKPLPENLTREEHMNDLPEEEKTCYYGSRLERTGEDTSEKLIIEEPRIYVERTVTPKHVCPCCKGGRQDNNAPCVTKQAPAVPSILPGNIVSASMLAHIFTAKFQDHLPYNRQEKQFKRIRVGVSRQDMANWQGKTGIILISLYALLKQTLKKGKVLRMDETTVAVHGGGVFVIGTYCQGKGAAGKSRIADQLTIVFRVCQDLFPSYGIKDTAAPAASAAASISRIPVATLRAIPHLDVPGTDYPFSERESNSLPPELKRRARVISVSIDCRSRPLPRSQTRIPFPAAADRTEEPGLKAAASTASLPAVNPPVLTPE